MAIAILHLGVAQFSNTQCRSRLDLSSAPLPSWFQCVTSELLWNTTKIQHGSAYLSLSAELRQLDAYLARLLKPLSKWIELEYIKPSMRWVLVKKVERCKWWLEEESLDFINFDTRPADIAVIYFTKGLTPTWDATLQHERHEHYSKSIMLVARNYMGIQLHMLVLSYQSVIKP